MRVIRIFIVYIIVVTFHSTTINAQNLNLKIKGKDSSETKFIDSLGYKKTFVNYKSLKIEIDTLLTSIQKHGYIAADLDSITKKNDSTFIAKLNLNKKYNTIHIYYNSDLFSKTILNSISEEVTPDYFVISIKNSEKVLSYLSSKVIEKGLPFAILYLSDIETKNTDTLKATLNVSSNQQRTINNILIKGYEKFPRSFIKYFLKIKEGSVFNLNEIKEKSKNLDALRFSNQAKSPEVLFTKDSTSVYLYLEKAKSNTFDGFLGFVTDETTNRIKFNGYLDLNLTNNLNYGESIALKYKSDENDQVTFEAKANLPYLFNSPIGIELSLNIFKRDTIFSTTSQSANIFYQITSNQKVYAGIDAINSTNLLDINTDQNLQDFNTVNYNIRYEYIKPQFNNILFPINFLFDIKGGFGNREFEDTTESQSIYRLNSFKIFNLNTKNSFYLRANGSTIISDNYLTNELLRFGGINSIRGFEENSILASLYGIINSEYRYKLSPNIYVHSIIDLAYFENDIANIKEKLFGFGFGFGLITKAGLLRFNYANGKTENQRFQLSDSKIQLSLSASF